MRRWLVTAVVASSLTLAQAQTGGVPALGRPLPPLAPASPSAGARMTLSAPATCCGLRDDRGFRDGRFFHRQHFFGAGPFGLLPLFFDGVYNPEPEYVPVPMYLPQPAPAAERSPEREPAEPLIIEREGDSFVRYGGAASSGKAGESRPLSQYRSSSREIQTSTQHPPVILLFRDNHQLEVADYVIVGSVLYDVTHSPAVPIRLAELNLPGTISLNRQRGVEFLLPTSANEVVLRF